MKIVLTILGAFVITSIAIEVAGNLIVRRAKARFDRMPSDEQRKRQEVVYKREQMGV